LEAVVLGAGAAGLGTAVTLAGIGADVTVLERTEHVGASWRSRYDGLRLNTTGWMSTLPGHRATRRRYGEYPTRESWIAYLEDHARIHGTRIRFGTEARRIDRHGRRWSVETNRGSIDADIVVVATGFDRVPDLPEWPGREEFSGELLHSSAYRRPDPYRDADVLVVGANTTGTEIANLLAKGGAARVRVACRTPPNIITRKFLGVSVNIPGIVLQPLPPRVGDQVTRLVQRISVGPLDRFGLPSSADGAATLIRQGRGPAYDDGFVAELGRSRIEIVPAVVGFDRAEVLHADGTRTQPDVVIAATGYRRGLEQLVGHLGVLDDRGEPIISGARRHPSMPGLFFNGYRMDMSGQLRLMRIDARAIARGVRRIAAEETPSAAVPPGHGTRWARARPR
jgi:putative flavoprotein involved in K+ transport